MEEFESWALSALNALEGNSESTVGLETVRYLSTFTTKDDLLEYLQDIVPKSTELEDFVNAFFENKSNIKLKPKKAAPTKTSTPATKAQTNVLNPVPKGSLSASSAFKSAIPKGSQPSFKQSGSPSPFASGPSPLKSKFTYVPPSQRSSASIKKETPVVETTVEDKQRKPSGKFKQNTGDLCLTMWQPWASLVVAGIKRVEGRSWYSEVRGRLWIHAASKVPSPPDIEEVEAFYREMGCKKSFPTSYPTSALLGCVEVTDMLSNAEYNAKYDEGEREENGSPYLFVCTMPQRLLLPIAMSGEHKIWKLDGTTVQNARRALLPVGE